MADASGLRAHLLTWSGQVHAKATAGILDRLREAAPVGEVDGGETRDSITVIPESSGPIFVSQALSPTPQSEWTEFGTSPHSIDPVDASVLVFPGDGGMVFARHVDHPGNAAQPWFFPTLETYWPLELAEAAAVFG